MRALIQRVTRAQATESGLSNPPLASIGVGMVLLVGIGPGDSSEIVRAMARKIRALRIFGDDQKKMNRSAEACGAELLVTSQFTLYADCSSGNRPSFAGAAERGLASELYRELADELGRTLPGKVSWTPFGSDLAIELVNDGPVTIWLDSEEVL